MEKQFGESQRRFANRKEYNADLVLERQATNYTWNRISYFTSSREIAVELVSFELAASHAVKPEFSNCLGQLHWWKFPVLPYFLFLPYFLCLSFGSFNGIVKVSQMSIHYIRALVDIFTNILRVLYFHVKISLTL